MSGSTLTKAGKKVYLYRNTGTYGTPVWNQITNRRDASLNGTATEADASDADSAFDETIVVSRALELSTQLKWSTGSDDWAVLKTAFMADPSTSIEFAVMDGPIATTGSTGHRLTCQITQFNESYPAKDVLVADVVAKPTPNADHVPEEYTVP